jgi:hypothetical protein
MRLLTVFIFLFAGSLLADPAERIALALADPARPVSLSFEQTNGSICVHGTATREVLIEATSRHRGESIPEGMHRLPTDLAADQDNNTVHIHAYGAGRDKSYDLYVPVHTAVSLRTTNGDIVVEGTDGEIDASSENGAVTLTNVGGAVVAHSLNGRVVATFTRCDSGKPMSFSSMNGRIDLTFPANLKAELRLKNQNGEISTDFEVTLHPTTEVFTGSTRKIKRDKSFNATVNGGGPEIQVSNFNGGIFLRKGR